MRTYSASRLSQIAGESRANASGLSRLPPAGLSRLPPPVDDAEDDEVEHAARVGESGDELEEQLRRRLHQLPGAIQRQRPPLHEEGGHQQQAGLGRHQH